METQKPWVSEQGYSRPCPLMSSHQCDEEHLLAKLFVFITHLTPCWLHLMLPCENLWDP